MQRSFTELREALDEFVEQRESLVLVLWHRTPTGLAFALKYLDAMEQGTRRDIYLVFGHEFTDEVGYIDALMSTCEMDIEAGNRVLAEEGAEDGATPWDGLPDACFDSSATTLSRLRALVTHVRRYYPEARHRIVLGLLPPNNEHRDAYARMCEALVPSSYEPWMAGLRIVVSDARDDAKLVLALAHRAETHVAQVLPLDFSTEAMQDALDRDASDPSVPTEERVKALIQLAGLDHAYGRLAESIAKYGVAYQYYVREKNPIMQGLCLLGQGYALERGEQVVDARERFRQALEIGISNESGQLMLNSLMAVAGLEQRYSQYGEAATYYETAAAVAKHLNNPFSCADALLHGGVCQVALDDTAKAREMWEVGVTIAGQGQYWPRVISLLEHLIEIERREGLTEERRRHEKALEDARREETFQQYEIAQAKRVAEASSKSVGPN